MKEVYMLGFLDHIGGLQAQMLRLSREMATKGINITILTSSGSKSGKFGAGKNMTAQYFPSPQNEYLFTVFFSLQMIAFFAGKKNHIMHAHHPSHGFAAAIAKKIFGGKLIVKIGASNQYTFSHYYGKSYVLWNRALLSLMKNTVDRFIVLNTGTGKELMECGIEERKILYIPSGVDCTHFIPMKATKKKHSALFVGRLEAQKLPDIMVKAWQNVTLEFPDAMLTIYGADKTDNVIEGLVKELALEKNITIVYGKKLSAQDYSVHEIYVSTSAYEGLSNSLLEAMACQMPIIATDITGVTEIIENKKNGMIVETGNPQQTAKAIKKLFTNKKLAEKIAKNARKKAKEMDVGKMAGKYMQLYDELERE